MCKDQVIFDLRFESPISISKWNDRLEFRRKSFQFGGYNARISLESSYLVFQGEMTAR